MHIIDIFIRNVLKFAARLYSNIYLLAMRVFNKLITSSQQIPMINPLVISLSVWFRLLRKIWNQLSGLKPFDSFDYFFCVRVF